MREIKFRAWNPKTNRIVYNVGVRDSQVLFTPWDYIPMQFTGLHDKNGKEIWEGDIFKNDRKDPFQIIFYDGSFRGWYGLEKEPSQDMRGFAFDRWEAEKGEVLGDIYSNPGLLKKEA